MMKRILGLLLLLVSGAVFAVPAAYVHALDGEARASTKGVSRAIQIGSILEPGDEVNVSAGTATLKFEDGQIVGLQKGSRFSIVNYQYNKTRVADSNVVLALLSGGMRYITGVIGGTRRDAISLRAGTATIGIRGTDVITFVDDNGNVLATVQDGTVSFASAGVTATVTPGRAVTAPSGGAPGSPVPVGQIARATVNTVTPLGLLITPGTQPVELKASAELVKTVAELKDKTKKLADAEKKAAAATDAQKAAAAAELAAAKQAVQDAALAATLAARTATIADQQAKQTAVQGGAPSSAGTAPPSQGQGVGLPPVTTPDPSVTVSITTTTPTSTTTETEVLFVPPPTTTPTTTTTVTASPS